jgi:hypothetical protein
MAEVGDNSEKKPDNFEHLDRSAMLPPGMDDLKPTIQRFSSSNGADSLAKATEKRLKEVANTPPDELSKSSQWRRDNLPPEGKSGMTIEGLEKGDQILAPFEGTAVLEYPKDNKQTDGTLSGGRITVSSKDSVGNSFNLTIDAKNIQLSGALGSSTDLTTTEDGIVKSSKGVPVKMGEPIGTFKNQPIELHLNASPGAPAPGNSSSAV